ncbi:10583_t:CDS:2, partial [Rhizophagus irregularis]
MLSKISTICYIHDSNERIYIKAFIPSDKNIETQIEDFEKGDMICLRGKFIACAGWFTINATSIKVIDGMDFDIMPPVGLSIMLEFWIEVNHDPNIRYLSNKTNSINQNIRSITAIIVSIINYEPPVINDMTQEEIAAEKHVVKLEDISLVSTILMVNRATPRTSRRGRMTLAQMSQPRNQNFPSALEENPILNMSTSPINNESSVPHKILRIKRFNDYFE